jgi:hypothetical protein
MRGEFINEYQKLNSEDQKTFRRFLWVNVVVGAILLAGLIALASFPGKESDATAQNAAMHTHAQAKLPPERASVARTAVWSMTHEHHFIHSPRWAYHHCNREKPRFQRGNCWI